MADKELERVVLKLWAIFGDRYFTAAEALAALPEEDLPKVVRESVRNRDLGRQPTRSFGRWLSYRHLWKASGVRIEPPASVNPGEVQAVRLAVTLCGSVAMWH